MKFKLVSNYKPTGDQPQAIEKLTSFIDSGFKYQTLWGVTGSGKTFTMANIIHQVQKPTLIIAHNKTLAAQLALELKEFFPQNAVHYFVSYYDYYQPEAYIKKTDTYIEKEATINEEIDRLRHAATQDLLTRKDVIIVASVSCIYGIGDISTYENSSFSIKVGQKIQIEEILKKLISMQYKREDNDLKIGTFRVRGDVLEIFHISEESVYSIEFWGNEISDIVKKNYLTGEIYDSYNEIHIFPARHTVTTKERISEIVPLIKQELEQRLAFFKQNGDILKYERLKTKVEYDIEMMMEVGYVNGIENYSRFLDGREVGVAPTTLVDYFGDDFLCLIDESHMTVPQIGAMFAGDRARKINLIENGFRLPSALDNRPLKFNEFDAKIKQMIFVSATPGPFEISKSIDESILKNTGTSKFKAKKSKSQNQYFEGILGENLELFENSLLDNINFEAFEYFKNYNPITDGNWQSSDKIRVVEQIIRPTGLLDPEIEILDREFMVDDVIKNLDYIAKKGERMIVTTLTKKSSEQLTDYLLENGYKVRYLHSEIETLERLEIIKSLRLGEIDAIVGVNLLREGLDLPEVSRIAILDADKQGFLRSESSLIQIIGRAARNVNGKVIFYTEKLNNFFELKNSVEQVDFTFGKIYRLDKGRFFDENGLVISESMKKSIDLTYYRRKVQNEYNVQNGIVPKTIFSSIKEIGIASKKLEDKKIKVEEIDKEIKRLEFEMEIVSANLDYEKAIGLRDQIFELMKRKRKARR